MIDGIVLSRLTTIAHSQMDLYFLVYDLNMWQTI